MNKIYCKFVFKMIFFVNGQNSIEMKEAIKTAISKILSLLQIKHQNKYSL